MSNVLRSLNQNTPKKSGRNEKRSSPGRPPGKENDSPQSETLKKAREDVTARRKRIDSLRAQQDMLVNPKGRSWAVEEAALILTLVLSEMMECDDNDTDVLMRVAVKIRRAYDSLHYLWTHWRDEKVIVIVGTEIRGAGSTKHINHSNQVTSKAILEITDFIHTKNAEGPGVVIKEIKDHLFTTLQLKFSSTTLRDTLHSLGYNYGKSKVIGMMNTEWRKQRIRYFLQEYSKALEKQTAGTHVIVYTDESYVNLHHAREATWYNPNDSENNSRVRPSGKGKRLVILHAITFDGWLVDDNSIHKDRADELSNSCELIYEANKSTGDYHKNMNGKLFYEWADNRLRVAFNKLYPNKKMIVVLDNAAYHHWKGENSFVVGKLRKTEVAFKLENLCGLGSITVKRQVDGSDEKKEITFLSHTWYDKSRTKSPTLEELREKLTQQLKLRPELNPSLLRKLMTDHGHELLYTPPYLPEVQPIERAWAYIKNYVASVYKNGRTMDELLQQVYTGMYGDGEKHSGLDGNMARDIIKHSNRCCCRLITEDPLLKGDLWTLRYVAPASPPDEEKDVDEDLNPFADEDDEEDQENENEKEEKE